MDCWTSSSLRAAFAEPSGCGSPVPRLAGSRTFGLFASMRVMRSSDTSEERGANASSPLTTSPTLAIRSAGFFSRHRSTRRSKSGGTWTPYASIGFGFCCTILATTAVIVSPSNGIPPVTIS